MRQQNQRAFQPWVPLLHSARSRAGNKNLPFLLTEEWAESRWTGRCELTDIPFTLGLRGNGAKMFGPSIDRIEPIKGYVPDNCRFVIWCVNAFKYRGSDDDMYFVAQQLLKHRRLMQNLRPTEIVEAPLL